MTEKNIKPIFLSNFVLTEKNVCRHYIGVRQFIDASPEARIRNFEYGYMCR